MVECDHTNDFTEFLQLIQYQIVNLRFQDMVRVGELQALSAHDAWAWGVGIGGERTTRRSFSSVRV